MEKIKRILAVLLLGIGYLLTISIMWNIFFAFYLVALKKYQPEALMFLPFVAPFLLAGIILIFIGLYAYRKILDKADFFRNFVDFLLGSCAVLLVYKGIKFLDVVSVDKISIYLIFIGFLILAGILTFYFNKASGTRIKKFSTQYSISIFIISSIFFLLIPYISYSPAETLKLAEKALDKSNINETVQPQSSGADITIKAAIEALEQNDVDKFAQQFIEKDKENYRSLFLKLSPQDKAELLQGLKTVKLENVDELDGVASYEMTTVKNGQTTSWPLNLQKDAFGRWKIRDL